jgi:hypothetical protein
MDGIGMAAAHLTESDLRTIVQASCRWHVRNIHEHFQPILPQNPHEYCVANNLPIQFNALGVLLLNP